MTDEELCRVYAETVGDAFDPKEAHLAGLRAVAQAASDETARSFDGIADVAEARAAYWQAEYAIATNAPRSRACREAVEASEAARAKLESLGAKP